MWSRLQRNHIGFVVMALGPVLILFALVRGYPIVETIRLSFYNYHITQLRRPFIGLRNYEALLKDDSFRTALLNTIAFSALAVTITLLLAFFIAVLLRSIERAHRCSSCCSIFRSSRRGCRPR